MAVAEEVGIERRLVAGAVPDLVLGPVARLALGVFVPEGRHAGEADDDLIDPAVAVDVVGPAGHALAVAVQAVAVIARLADVVLGPRRGLVPRVADQHVELAVLVHVGDRHALGAELALDDRLLPRDGRLLVAPAGGSHRQQDGGQAQGDRPASSHVHRSSNPPKVWSHRRRASGPGREPHAHPFCTGRYAVSRGNDRRTSTFSPAVGLRIGAMTDILRDGRGPWKARAARSSECARDSRPFHSWRMTTWEAGIARGDARPPDRGAGHPRRTTTSSMSPAITAAAGSTRTRSIPTRIGPSGSAATWPSACAAGKSTRCAGRRQAA